MRLFTNLLFFVFISSAVSAQYRINYQSIDSLEVYNTFYVNVIDTTTERIVAEGAYSVNWYKFKIEVNYGKHLGSGQIFFDRNKVYENGNKLVITLTNYLNDTLQIDTLKIPHPNIIRLNYMHEFPFVNERLKLDLGCIYSNGNAALITDKLGLDWSLFTLTSREDTFNPEFFFVPYYSDSPTTLLIKATYNYDTSIWHGFYLDCRYSDTLQFDFTGANGENGKNGKPGTLRNYYDHDGAWGWNGGHGNDAPSLNVVLIPLESEEKVLLKVLMLSDIYQHFFFIDPTKAQVKFDISGGRGGRGGNGGDGVNGNPNANNNRDSKGGNGGDGGNGGNGGNGGELKVITSQAGKEYAKIIRVKNDGGKAGLPGFGGKGGQTFVRENAGFFERKFNEKNGRNGEMGESGFNGYGGTGPILWLVDDSEILKLLLESETW